jgi:uncharacterized protein YqgC (DUF456 family)
MTVFLAVVCAILMVAGFAGLILPVLPAIQLNWLGLVIYAWGTGFQRISLAATIAFTVVMVLDTVLDWFVQAIGARQFKASKYGIIGALIGSIVGLIFFNIWGVILGPAIGAVAGELIARRGIKQALVAAGGTFAGCLAGSLVKAVIMLVMLGFFIVSLF